MSKLQKFQVVENVCVYRTYWDRNEDGPVRPRLTEHGHSFYYHKEKNLGTYKTLKGAKNKCEKRCQSQRLKKFVTFRYKWATIYEVTYTELSIEITDC